MRVFRPPHRRQRGRKKGAVARRDDPRIEDGDDPAVVCAAEKAAGALREKQGGVGCRHAHEAVSPGVGDSLCARLGQRIVGAREGNAVDEDEPARAARDVDALPQRQRAEQAGGVVLGEGRTKVIVPVTAETFDEIKEQTASIAKLGGQTASGAGNGVDVVEWRMDFLAPSIDVLSALETLAGFTDLPVLATFRTADEGGKAIEASAYRDLLLAVARSGKVSAIDVEAFRHESTVREVIDRAHEAGVAVLASYHDFHATPAAEEIIARLEAMDAAGADVLKLACMPTSVDDLLVLLNATHRASRTFDRPLITVAMGPIGVLSRIAGGVFGSCATFAAVGRGSAPGQIPVSDLRPALDLLDSAQSATF